MALYFIEMGQGIIARPEMRVKTSTIYSCSFITGWSTKTRFGGAFHFPAKHGTHPKVLAAMALWVFYLKPTAIKLLFAHASSNIGVGTPYELGTPQADRNFLQRWVTDETGLIPTCATAVGACMSLTEDLKFTADDGRNLPDIFDGEVRDVSRFRAGDYSYRDHILVGRNMA